MIPKKFEEKINIELTRSVEKQLANVPTSAISSFLCCKITFQNG